MRGAALTLFACALSLSALAAVSACTPRRTASRSSSKTTAPSPITTVEQVIAHERARGAPRLLEGAVTGDADDETRARAALALARAEHLEAAPLLYRAAKDDEAAVRAYAAFGLGQLDLALEAGRGVHDQTRAGLEGFLASWHKNEEAPFVRAAIVRALGRVSVGPGLEHLLQLASSGSERGAALTALGVSGARRAASLSSDARLLAAVTSALGDDDVEVRRAAAYAAFRQKLPVAGEAMKRAARDADAQVRIHVARAWKEHGKSPADVVALLDDGDWRVRVEAVRALAGVAAKGGELPIADLARAGFVAAKRVAGAGGSGAEAHVVGAVCDALSSPELPAAPDQLRPVVDELLASLAGAGAKASAVRCQCAVAHDALVGRPEAVTTCAEGWSDEQVRRLHVDVMAKARMSSRERAAWLKKALADAAVPVRVRAAYALVDDGSRPAAEVAAEHLEREEDPAVAGVLLQLFEGANAAALADVTLARVVDRFVTSARTFEEMEPLLAAAPLLRDRPGATARAAAEQLLVHPEPRLRELVKGVPHGERAHVARARSGAPLDESALPGSAVLVTERGEIQLKLERELAPSTVDNFALLAKRGFFDGLAFHRVVSDFVAQGGDPRGDGSGGPGYTIPCENSEAPYTRGAVGMALAGKDTGGSQFFLTHSDQPHLEGRYTVFARVVRGLDVMDALMPDDRILQVRIAE